jgi:hypothetical protein
VIGISGIDTPAQKKSPVTEPITTATVTTARAETIHRNWRRSIPVERMARMTIDIAPAASATRIAARDATCRASQNDASGAIAIGFGTLALDPDPTK